MSNNEVSPRVHESVQTVDQAGLRFNVKVNQHISAKNKMNRGVDQPQIRKKVQPVEVDFFLQLCLDFARAIKGPSALLEILLQISRIGHMDALCRVYPLGRFAQSAARYVGGQDVPCQISGMLLGKLIQHHGQ